MDNIMELMKNTLKNIAAAAIMILAASCAGEDWREGYQLPPQLPGESVDEEDEGEFGTFPSLLTEDEAKRMEELDGSFSPGTNLLSGGTYLSTLEYVVLLFKDGQTSSLERGEKILKTIISAQVTDKASQYYGSWPWGINQNVNDLNPPLFFARRMLGELWSLQERMRPGMLKAYLSSCELLVHAAEHRWDTEKFAANRAGVRYTNAFTLYVETLTLAGKCFEDESLQTLAEEKWNELYTHFKQYGADEFLSRDYDDVTFNALWSIHENTGEAHKKEVTEVMDYLFITKTAVVHPKLYTPVVGISRDDRLYSAGNDARSEFIKPNKAPAGYAVPQEADNLKNNRQYPFEINGRSGDYTFTWKSYMENEHAAMGSMTGWGCYYSQNVHLMACAGNSTSARSTIFIPGSYIYANGFTDQKELTALVVYNRLATLWHAGQWGGNPDNISETFFDFGVGLSTQWKEVSSESGKIVLDANGRGYCVYLYPFVLNSSNQIEKCSLTKVSRTKSSEKYHVEDLKFDELVFPSDAVWFGVYVNLVPSDETPADPEISFEDLNGHFVFSTDAGHRLEIENKEGAYVQVRDKDPMTELPDLYKY